MFQRLFSPFEVVAADEMTLGANKVLSESTRLHWKVAEDMNRTPRDWRGIPFLLNSSYTFIRVTNFRFKFDVTSDSEEYF